MKRFSGISIFIVLALVLAACTAGTPSPTAPSGGGTTGGTTPAVVNVEMSQIQFVPQTVTVKVGTTVVWTNKDQVDHNVTADDGSFASGNIAPGGTFSYTFNTAGTYDYKCTIHQPAMVGTIIVTP